MVILFLVSMIVVSIAVSLVFMNKISKPVTAITENIEDITNEKYQTKNNKGKLFSDVFEKLFYLNSKLNENKRLKNEWISNISHDIKTPLSSIKGYAEIMSNEKYDVNPSEMATYASEILKSEVRIEELLSDLKISSILDGNYTIKKEETNICELIKNCVDEIEPNIKKNSKIEVIAPLKISTECNDRLIKRSIKNIIYNALVHNDKPILIIIALTKIESGVLIDISDNGKGINSEQLPNIFKRYYSGESTDKQKGSGLGLAIAKDAIQNHGGDITVESLPYDHTTFHIFLP